MSLFYDSRPEVVEMARQSEFCHLDDGSDERAWCGDPSADGPLTCADHDGSPVCVTCGLPVCPRCIQLSDLDELAEGRA